MRNKKAAAAFVSLALATAIHLDWHAARPTTHHLSLGLSNHWLLAVPVFALVAWYVARSWPAHILPASLAIVGSAIVVAGVLEPAWEYFLAGATFEWAFGRVRTMALVTFVGTGLLAYVAVISFLRRSAPKIVDP